MQSLELTELANRFGSDKGDSVLCAHAYTRIYASLLASARNTPLRLLEIGLVHGHTQETLRGHLEEVGCPSLKMWAEYLPRAQIFGIDIEDFCSLSEPRITVFRGDQSNPDDLVRVVRQAGGPFDIIIDDGSHASHHQQIALACLFEHLAPGGLYCIEDLHYQPNDLEIEGITRTREFLHSLRFDGTGARIAMEQHELARLLGQIASIHFFDSQSTRWSLAQREDALAVIAKRGAHSLLGDAVNGLPPVGMRPEKAPHNAAGTHVHSLDSFVGHAAIHGQRVYCCSAVLSPDPRHWKAMGGAQPPHIVPTSQAAVYRLGDHIDFRQGGNALMYQRQGWDFSSAGGTWTVAPTGRLALTLVGAPTEQHRYWMEVDAQTLVAPSHPSTNAELVVNEVSLGVHAFGANQTLRVPFELPEFGLAERALTLEFRVFNPVSPHSLALSEDRRELGLLLIGLRLLCENDLCTASYPTVV